MRYIRGLIVGIGLILISFPAASQGGDGIAPSYDIGIFGGFSTGGDFKDAVTDDAVELEGSASGGIVMRIRQTDRTFIELLYSEQSTRTRANGFFTGDPLFDITVRNIQFGGVYELDEARNRSYVAGSLGLTHFEPEGDSLESETRFAMGLGAGYSLPVTRASSVRIEARAIGTLFNTNGDLFCTNGRCRLTIDSDVLWQTQLSLIFAVAF